MSDATSPMTAERLGTIETIAEANRGGDRTYLPVVSVSALIAEIKALWAERDELIASAAMWEAR